MSLTPDSLAEVMEHRLPIEGYRALFPAMNQAMIDAGCVNINRSAAWMSQIGVESGGLRWMEEIADGSAYEGRRDLGNTQPGDGRRFKGHGPIQITGRHNHQAVSDWAFEHGYVPAPNFFVDHPEELAGIRYGFLGAVWYWTVARADINDLADAGDVVEVTHRVNGGEHGLRDRIRIWDHARAMGTDIVPDGRVTPPPPPNVTPRHDWRGDPTFLPEVLRAFGVDAVEYPGWRDRGHGDFGAIGWVLWHHTGNRDEQPETIAHHPALGLAANMHIAPNGTVTLCGVGVAWHGGEGIYPGIPEDGINQVSIGIECAYGPNFSDPWPDAQVESMIRVGAALTWFLGFPANHNIAHKEWAGADNPLGINKQGKPDPANFNMDWFRNAIAERVAAGPTNEGDDFMPELSGPEQRELLELMRWAFHPEYGEFRKLFASRSPYRDGEGRFETIAGFALNHDAASNAADIVEEGARAGLEDDIDRLRRLAHRRGPGATQWWTRKDHDDITQGEPDEYWVARARAKLKECTGEVVTDDDGDDAPRSSVTDSTKGA